MPNIIETIYTQGVFKPLKKVNLPENTRVEITTLRDFSYGRTPKDLLGILKYAQETFQKAKIKIPSGLSFQKKIRKESDLKVKARLKPLNV